MLYFTGDTHGTLERFWDVADSRRDCDTLVVLGDFGMVWNPQARDEQRKLDELDAMPYRCLFIDGNHENHEALDAMPVEKRDVGRVHVLRENVLHLVRGQVVRLPTGDGGTVSCAVMGGATSVDAKWRTPHVSWWEREMPSDAEFDALEEALDAHARTTDLVLTHTLPAHLKQAALSVTGAYEHDPAYNRPDKLEQFLEHVSQTTTYQAWLFGHWHIDYAFDDRHICLYEDVLALCDVLSDTR